MDFFCCASSTYCWLSAEYWVHYWCLQTFRKHDTRSVFSFPHHIALISNNIVYCYKTTVLDGGESKAFILVNNKLAEALASNDLFLVHCCHSLTVFMWTVTGETNQETLSAVNYYTHVEHWFWVSARINKMI